MAGGGQVLRLIHRDQALDVDNRVGLDPADLVDGGAEFFIIALVVVVAQLVDPQGDVDLAVLLQGQGLQGGVFLPVDGQGFPLGQLEDGHAVGGQIFAGANAAVEHKTVGAGVAHKGGVVKVAVFHRLPLGDGLGEVVERGLGLGGNLGRVLRCAHIRLAGAPPAGPAANVGGARIFFCSVVVFQKENCRRGGRGYHCRNHNHGNFVGPGNPFSLIITGHLYTPPSWRQTEVCLNRS